jgi:hypothetical protein
MSSDKTEVIILTNQFRIEGEIALIQGARITDFVNEAKRFMAITSARVFTHEGREVLAADFINLQMQEITLILPADALHRD